MNWFYALRPLALLAAAAVSLAACAEADDRSDPTREAAEAPSTAPALEPAAVVNSCFYYQCFETGGIFRTPIQCEQNCPDTSECGQYDICL